MNQNILRWFGTVVLCSVSYLNSEACGAAELFDHFNHMLTVSMATDQFVHELNPRVS